ncbi:MAG: cyclase family protein [Candidatus Kariarchaeaceae archaeon]|jgi:kynurenine formamidase
MSQFIDLSHDFEDSMPGFKLKNEDGSITQYTANIYPFLTHEQTSPMFNNLCSFEITEIKFQTSIGTYLDSPYHRYPNGKDISEIDISSVILDGVVIDVRNNPPNVHLTLECIPNNLNITEKAVLFNFGWDKYWGKEKYHEYPFISNEIIEYLVTNGVKLVGVDTINIDNSKDLTRPAHSKLLKNEILIIENLTNLNLLLDQTKQRNNFRFFAVPIKAKKVAAMPVRAFAEII